jgi:RNA polymerase sigma-70 factor (ECF subfamily)
MIEDLYKYSDEELLKLASGNETQAIDAFNIIYNRYSKRIIAYCRLVEQNRELIDDVFQEAWIGLYNAILAGKSISNISSFLITIIRRKLIDEIRRNKRKESNLSAEAIDNIADNESTFNSVELIEKKQ